MCGIAGEVSQLTPDDAHVRRSVEMQRHRGPDAHHTRRWSDCVLGHARLRIIDTSTHADQPMSNEDGSIWTVFNGEIYNFADLRARLESAGHRFRTRSDTEVLVHLYEEHGREMVKHLRGMFAFAIWDERHRSLLLARDRLGIKPLYYREGDETLRFASEVRPLREPTDTLDPVSLGGYLRLGWVPGPRTIFVGVNEVPAGHFLEWRGGRAHVERWWQPPHRDPNGIESSERTLSHALSDATDRHLVSDVPIGLFLSSGLDSSALAALAAKAQVDAMTYTVDFDFGPSEAVAAARYAKRMGLEHTVVMITGGQVLADLPSVIADMDQPTVDGVNTWVISRAVREAGIKVALSGLGGDEIFGGYSTFDRIPPLVRAGGRARVIPRALRAQLAQFGQRSVRHDVRRASEAIVDGGWSRAYASMRGVTGAGEHLRLTGGQGGDGLSEVSVPGGLNALDSVTQLELANYLPFQLLRDSDTMSMAHGLELRVPLLDDAVVAAALRYPHDMDGRSGKARLAAAVDPELLRLASAPKQTFTLPFDSWLKGPLAQSARAAVDRLAEPAVGLAPRELDDLWGRWESGRIHWRTVWALAALGMWIDRL